jgi:hypothetical protein
MSKITRLETIHTHLSIRLQYFINRLLRLEHFEFTKEVFDNYTQTVGQGTVMQAEIKDHCDSLRGILLACRHGLAGTNPEGFEEWGYEFAEDPEQPLAPYDPYADILGYLRGGLNISCMALSPALLRFIELLPEVAADRAERDVFAKDGVLLRVDDEGQTHPMTQEELRCRGDQALLDALEESMFATTYAEDMLRIQQLATERGDLQQIQDLVEQA